MVVTYLDKSKKGLGSFVYTEWIRPLHDYYCTILLPEVIYEIVVPIIISLVCSIIYKTNNKTAIALSKLADILPTVVSILIGFTVMLITILLTVSGGNIEELKKQKTNKKIGGKFVSLYQGLHIQFSHSLLLEIALLLMVLVYLFLHGLCKNGTVEFIFLLLCHSAPKQTKRSAIRTKALYIKKSRTV